MTSAGAIETFYMIGAEDRISAIGTSRAGIWPEDKTADLPSVGNLARPSFEKIIAAEPDLAIINGMNSDLAQQLTAVGIPVLVHNPGSIEEIINSILVLGILSGTKEKAVELVSERWGALQKIQNELNEEPLNLKGAFVYALEPLQAFSAESLPGEILKILGVSNIAASTSGQRPILTTEYILQQNPDFLFGAMSINNEKDLLNANSAITKTRAGQEKNIFIIPSQLILRPSPRIIDALSMLHEKLKEIGPASTDGEAD
ncbi:ABC transporter substrate-binding protein [Marispirochaeta sp.]|uniref:ABC transporter substrate-binding protein n=1 Tax=Marispirochaeta sp. TaxID=2038653 RepID=UPI0029C69FAC|nr:ABC transporter substrate-binding protein [Marispirochaeta sp.]